MSSARDSILYLSRKEVEKICEAIDSVAVMHRMFVLHETKKTILPAETGLYWQNEQGETVRSLNMPGYIGDSIQAVGTKIINGNTANLKHGYPVLAGLPACLIL